MAQNNLGDLAKMLGNRPGCFRKLAVKDCGDYGCESAEQCVLAELLSDGFSLPEKPAANTARDGKHGTNRP